MPPILRLLDVACNADPSEIKSGYRRKALQLHPDVNSAEDAAERFTELSAAYGVYQHVAEPSSDLLLSRSQQLKLVTLSVIVALVSTFNEYSNPSVSSDACFGVEWLLTGSVKCCEIDHRLSAPDPILVVLNLS